MEYKMDKKLLNVLTAMRYSDKEESRKFENKTGGHIVKDITTLIQDFLKEKAEIQPLTLRLSTKDYTHISYTRDDSWGRANTITQYFKDLRQYCSQPYLKMLIIEDPALQGKMIIEDLHNYSEMGKIS